MNDQVTLVDGKDVPIGVMDKIDAHRGNAYRHRAISVFLFNSRGELLIQQRSMKKIIGALQWANTCCGNVWPGESYEACAHRRLKFELGIVEVKLTQLFKFEYHVQCNEIFSEWEIDTIFRGHYDGPVFPNLDEVKTYAWKSRTTLQTDLIADPKKYVPWLPIILD